MAEQNGRFFEAINIAPFGHHAILLDMQPEKKLPKETVVYLCLK
jgi:hypothetical protein